MAFNVIGTDRTRPAEPAQIRIVRHSGWFGKFVRLDVRCKGRTVARLREYEQAVIRWLPSELPASLRVQMQHRVGSPVMWLESLTEPLRLECGARGWTLLDAMGLYLLPGFRHEVFDLRHSRDAD